MDMNSPIPIMASLNASEQNPPRRPHPTPDGEFLHPLLRTYFQTLKGKDINIPPNERIIWYRAMGKVLLLEVMAEIGPDGVRREFVVMKELPCSDH